MSEDLSESKSILVVDDDQTTVLLTRLFLESMSIKNIYSSSNGQEAINFLSDHAKTDQQAKECPDIVLLDLNMPVMDGFEFLEEYSKKDGLRKKDISIVILTSSDSKRDRDRIKQIEVNVAGYIVKPLTEEKIKPFL